MENINEKNFNFCKELLNLNTERSIKIFTLLTNILIWMIYFPAEVKKLRENFPYKKKNQFLSHEKNYERIYGLCLLIKLFYKGSNKLKKGYTDSKIDDLIASDENMKMIKDFFIYNSLPPNINNEEYRGFLEKIEYPALPELGFDPDYEDIVLKSDASLHLVLFTKLGVIFSRNNYHLFKYIPTKSLLKEYFGMFDNTLPKRIMNLNPELRFSQQVTEFTLNIGIPIFGSENFIDDIIGSFKKYYCKSIPSRATEIEGALRCFSLLLKISHGKSYFEIQWNDLKDKLIHASSEEISNWFLEQFCFNKRYEEFPSSFDKFNPKILIGWWYNQFLNAGCFYHFGKVISGVFLLWRALIKFFEKLHREKEFFTRKGKLLEDWTFKVVESYEFESEKIILINREKNPGNSKAYNSLKLQVKDFFKEPIEIKAEFPDHIQFEKSNKIVKASNSYFSEIDLAFRIDNCLFMIECKGTSVLRSEEPNVLQWMVNFSNEIKKLKFKGELLKFNIDNGIINSRFLKGIEYYIPLVVNTEGLSGYSGLFHTKAFILYLGELKAYINKGKFKDFLKRRVYEFKDKSDQFRDYGISLDDYDKLEFEIVKYLAENPNLRKLIEENEKK